MNIRHLFRELRYEMFKNILLDAFLRAVIAFLIIDIFLSILGLSYIFSFIAAAMYFSYRMTKKMRSIRLKVFEEHNPEIREMLSTAADNLNRDNLVIQELFKEVIAKMRKVSSGTLIEPKSLVIMVIAIPLLAVLNFELSPIHVDIIDQDALLEGLQSVTFTDRFFNRTQVDVDIEDDILWDDDIYGERRVAQLGDQEISIKMQSGEETDFTRPRPEDTEQITFRDYPDQEAIDIVYDGKVASEHIVESDLARRYNERIRELR